jgi:hypothetical protein
MTRIWLRNNTLLKNNAMIFHCSGISSLFWMFVILCCYHQIQIAPHDLSLPQVANPKKEPG